MKKNFRVNESILWFNADKGISKIKAIITEVHKEYCIAKTDDNMTLRIDLDNEIEFIRNENSMYEIFDIIALLYGEIEEDKFNKKYPTNFVW